ncbi:hypothetical protein M407DRAFT_21242 [Tulasnella calospora MUT 4182]|uniref:Spc7 kinetochore protein domain-containing protein n=1 Tax=Tulasnella calospora MUT 4182 TaxID=1051891 RepID=A0A0C3QEL0_9AGAM|nr:hypothetical protein M407DRAFT_21242 [Tulasnella calospora MUT 4182]
MVSFDKENPRPRASLPVNGASKLDLTPTKKARRSMAPRKSILKGINLNDDVTQDLTDASDMLSGRKSLARRVSFAAHAQVRLYTKDSKNPEGQSPARPPAQQPSSEPQPAPRRSSIRRRSSTSKTQNQLEAANAAIDNWEEGDSAMSLEDDDYGANAQLYVTGQNETAEDGDEATEEEQSMDQGEDEDEGEDMDVTVSFKNNIYVSGAAKRRSSVRPRPSVSKPPPVAPEQEEEVAPPSPARSTRTDASEPMEFTVALEQAILPSKRASLANEAWANLQALQPQSSTLASPSNEMNVDDAMRRMLAASPGTARQLALDAANGVEEGDSMDMSMDGSLAGRRSVGSARDDQTMDLTSIVQSRSILGQSQLLNTTLDQEQEVAELSIHEEREQELAGLGAQGDNPFLLPPPPSLPPPTSEQQDLAHSTAAAAAAATSAPIHSMFSSIGAGFNFNNHDDPLMMMPVSQEGGLADPPLSLPSLRFSTASAHGDQIHAAEEEAANNVQTADWLADFITPGAMDGEQVPAAATAGGSSSSIFDSSIFGKSATSTQPQPELSNSSTTRAALASSTRDDVLSSSTAGNTLANSTTSSRPLRLSTSITRNIFSRSKIPSPVKKLPSGQGESLVPLNSFMSPPVRGTPTRRNESPTRTPSRATTGAKVAPPTFTFSPAKSTSSTPNRNGKRPAEDALEATVSPAKKKVALGDALDRPTPQRAVSAEPAFTPSLLAKTSTTSLAPPPETPRETSAPPDLEVQSTSSLPSGGRRSSFAARRGARKNSMIPPSGALGLSTIRELSESTMTTLGRSVAAPRGEKETDDEIDVDERLEDLQEQHEEYQQPIAPASDVARSSPVRKVERNVPKIAVTEFLDMAGIRFHDNMPVQRRHTMGPEALTMTFPDGTMGPLPDDDHEFSLADYYRAEAIHLGQLEMFIWASFSSLPISYMFLI